MGVVKREGIKQSIVNYIATAIGTVNVLYIYPKLLDPKDLGLFQFLNNTAMLLVPFSLFGIHSLVVKFFPKFEDPNKNHNNMLSFLLLLSLATFTVFFALLFFNVGSLELLFTGQNQVVIKYFGLIALLVLLMQTNMLLTVYLLNFKKVVVPAIMNHLIKIVIPIAVLFKTYNDWSFTSIAIAMVVNYSLVLIILTAHLAWIKELKFGFDFSFIKGPLRKEMRVFAGFGLLGSVGTVLATRIDLFMVGTISELEFAAVYAIGMAIANVIQIPITAVNTLTQPLISKAWHENDTDSIDDLYKKGSISLLIFSIAVFVLVMVSIDDLYTLIPKGNFYKQGKLVVFFLGLSKVFDALTSVNSSILRYSDKFRFDLYFMLILAVVNTSLNIFLIPKYGITGAALATAISIMSYNILKLLFIYKQFKMQPFTINTVKILVIGVVTYGIGLLISLDFHGLINIFIRSAIVGLSMLFVVFRLNISEDFNGIVRNVLKRVGVKLPE